MSKQIKKTKKKRRNLKPAGAPPGTLLYTGKNKEEVVISLIKYSDKNFEESKAVHYNEIEKLKSDSEKTWFNINGIHDESIIKTIGENAKISPLLLEDLVNVNQRPKTEFDSESVFVTLKMLIFNEETNSVESEQVSIFCGKNYLFSFQEKEGDLFDPIRQRIRAENVRIRKNGTDYLLYALVDIIIDHYFYILEIIEDKIDELEDSIFSHPDSSYLQEIQKNKKNIFQVKRAIFPLREAVNALKLSDSPLISENTKTFLSDVYDHVIQLIDQTDALKEFNAGLKDIYLNTVSLKMNQIMQVLTISSVIFIPLTFIAGIYGMNFDNMPELHTENGYFVVVAIMVIITIGLLFIFKKKKWL